MKEKGGHRYKKLTLLFENEEGSPRPRSILKLSKELTFSQGYEVTLEKVFKIFSQKGERPGNFEMLNGVICNWNCFMGRYHPLWKGYIGFDLREKDWIQQLPVFEYISEAKLISRYNLNGPLAEGESLLIISANRATPTMDIAETHGFMKFAMSDGWGNYVIYPFTFLAKQFTSGWTQYPAIDTFFKVLRLAKTEPGLWAYPDETVFYTRQQAEHAIVISREKFLEHLEILRSDIMNARGGNEPFQISYKNCAGTVQIQAQRIHGSEVVPDVFSSKLTESTPRPPLENVFDYLKTIPFWRVMVILWAVGLILGAYRKLPPSANGSERRISLMQTPLFTSGKCYHAAKIFNLILSNQISGVIWYGHGRD